MKQKLKKTLKAMGWAVLALVILIAMSTAYNIFRDVPYHDLSLVDQENQKIDINELYKDKTTIINFWATWCKPCVAEMPLFEELGQILDKNEWQIILVSDEPLENIKNFKTKKGYSSLFLKLTNKFGNSGIFALPKTMVIGKDGKAIFENTGEITENAEQFAERLRVLVQ